MEHEPVKLKIKTAPASEPVTVPEAKLHCRVDIDDDDSWFSDAIAAARLYCETASGRLFVTQTVQQYWCEFPECGTLRLEGTPLASVTSVTYVSNVDGSTVTVAADQYLIDQVSDPACIVPAFGKFWPACREQRNSVCVEYVVGVAAGSVDKRVKQAILMLVAHWYRNRETVVVGVVSGKLEFAVTQLMAQVWNGSL